MNFMHCLGSGLALVACLDVTEERVERDQQVGKAEAAGARVEVVDGLAAVRSFAPDKLELWANAPVLVVSLGTASEAPERFTLGVRNALADAELEAKDGAGNPLPVSVLPAALPTERNFEIAGVTPNARIELKLAPPDADSREPFDFIALADVQEAIGEVDDVFERMNQETSARFAMFSGDLTEEGNKSELGRFQREMNILRFPIYVTLGNHELGDAEVPYHRYFGRGSQSFWFRHVRFTTLDSASATIAPKVYDWLEGWLAGARDANHLAFMHVPPLDPSGVRNGAFSSRAEAAKLLGMLGRGRVDTTFYGHIHSYYAFENAGIPAFISGGGGAIPERFDRIGRHFLRVRVDPSASGTDVHLIRVD